TVGFISDLPHHLVAAFRATLEEVEAADIILHVRDIAHPDTEAQRQDVTKVLRDMGIDPEADARVVEVLNKIDLVPADDRDALVAQAVRAQGGRRDTVRGVSALTGEGFDGLYGLIDERMTSGRMVVDLTVDLHDGAALAWLYSKGEVLERQDDDCHAHLQVALDGADLARFERRYAYHPQNAEVQAD
ncbi:MAG TPA: GTPase HflX, partial [Azospirillaceae bacterium]|nr:GTPase HflX [Azospirillaceae bacterium]